MERSGKLSVEVLCADPFELPAPMVVCEVDRLLTPCCATAWRIEQRCGEALHRQLHAVASDWRETGGLPLGDVVPVRISNCGRIKWAVCVVSRKNRHAAPGAMTVPYRNALRAAMLYRVESLILPLGTVEVEGDPVERMASLGRAIRTIPTGDGAPWHPLPHLYIATDRSDLIARIVTALDG